MSDRIACVVPFCRCTASRSKYPYATEIVCPKHWRLVRRRTKWLYAAVKRKMKRLPHNESLWALNARTWERAKREAIEKAGGIG